MSDSEFDYYYQGYFNEEPTNELRIEYYTLKEKLNPDQSWGNFMRDQFYLKRDKENQEKIQKGFDSRMRETENRLNNLEQSFFERIVSKAENPIENLISFAKLEINDYSESMVKEFKKKIRNKNNFSLINSLIILVSVSGIIAIAFAGGLVMGSENPLWADFIVEKFMELKKGSA
ncbi:hypothetical protein ACTL6P_15420 [Endozoicomonas acroporae]|uniref:hypothetical protein n=1 Tax=Endozoicomonas acroporae TaxID=1701104 RepID=UPI000C76513B|nr:hypothetical protein [Endozoicomonas acroporae]